MNNITTIGYLTADPVVNTTPNGQNACKFRLASNNKRRDENNNFGTNFYNCTAWGKSGDVIARYFKKGQRILVSGDLTIRDYTDRNGAPRTSVDIDVRDWDFGERNNGGGQTQAPAQAPTPVPQQAQRPQMPPMTYGTPTSPQAPQMMYASQTYTQAPAPQQPMYQPQPQAPAPQSFTPVEDDQLPFD